MTYAVVHPPNFFAQAAARPDMRRAPFAVMDGEAPHEFVFAANRAAFNLGLELGMNRLPAQACGALLIERSRERERAAQAKVHALTCDFSPRIEAVEEMPGTFALDIRGMGTIFGDATQLVNKLRQRVMANGYLVNVAASENYHAALCLACGRSGVTVVPAGQEAAALAALPLHVLSPTTQQTETFAAWGIRTCGELAALKETDLISRMGQSARRLHMLARGVWPHHLTPIEESFESTLVERIALDFPVEELEPLSFLIARLLTSLLGRVQSKARAIAAVHLVLDLDGGGKHERTGRPALPLEDARTLLKLMQLDLETHPPSAGVIAVELQAQSAAPHRAQHGLFLPQSPEPEQTEVLLARLNKLLGDERVGSPMLLDDHRPDLFRMVQFQPPAPRPAAQYRFASHVALRVCRPPQSIDVTVVQRRPKRLFWKAAAYDVVEAAGPVRLSGQWWTEEHWGSEEWDVRLRSDANEYLCRIHHDPRSHRWHMQGFYD